LFAFKKQTALRYSPSRGIWTRPNVGERNLATSEGSATFCRLSPVELSAEASLLLTSEAGRESPCFPWRKSQSPRDYLLSGIFAIGRRTPSLSSSLYPEWYSNNKNALVVHNKRERKIKLY